MLAQRTGDPAGDLQPLDNAAKFDPSGAPIEVTVRDRGGSTCWIGAPGYRTRGCALVFERFHRADKGADDAGFGIGLWIVRDVADATAGLCSPATATEAER